MAYNKQQLKDSLHETMRFAVSGLEKSVQFYLNLREAVSEEIDINAYETQANGILRRFQHIAKPPASEKEKGDYLKKSINDFDIRSNCVKNSLKRENIKTVKDLSSRTELDIYSLRGVGNLNLRILRRILTDVGLDFKENAQ